MFRNALLWLIIILSVYMAYSYFNTEQIVKEELPYSEFIDEAVKGNIKTVIIKDKIITGEFADGKKFETYAAGDPSMVPLLQDHNVKIYAKPPDQPAWYIQFAMTWLPTILLLGIFWFFIVKNMQGGNKAFSFGKSKAKMVSQDQLKITFKDVAGVDEAKEELEEIVDFLKDPQKFQKIGGKIPKGVLLVGPPGTGKTLLARAVAGEAGVPFFSISGSDFVEMFVGVGASRVRDLFEQGKKNSPCIIFIDEIDAVGRHRGAGLGGGHDEREQTLNALLVEMDGFEANSGVILVAATNRPDVLDPALLRPGRFDRQVVVPTPDVKGRELILKVHTAKIPMEPDVDLEVIAKGTPGFSGAELANLANEAALLTARLGKDKVGNEELEEAKDKVMMGKERRSMKLNDETKKVIAYHEAGHAIVGLLTPGRDPVHKVTIIPRGIAYLGATYYLPQEDLYIKTKEYFLSTIITTMGGRAAEKIVFDQLSSGASNDIKSATSIAKAMVTAYGMSDVLGPVSYAKKDEAVFLGKELSSPKDYSEETAVVIDKEVKNIIEACYDKALTMLKDNRLFLDKMSDALLERETIDAKEVRELMKEYIDEKWREVALANNPEPGQVVDNIRDS